MKYSVLGYLIGEGFRNVLKNKKSTAASLMIMCATMFVFGIFFLIGQNVQNVIKQVEEQQAMQVFIKPDATEQEITDLGTKIREIEYVNKAEYVTKEDALNTVKTWLKDSQGLLEPYAKNNPFKASYVVTLTDLSKIQEVESKIAILEQVNNITVRNETINRLLDIANGVKTVSAVILVLLIFISIFIIANTIKLTVHARRKEISIMKYVGATDSFIRWPFIIEGIIIGIIAAIISLAILGLAYNLIISKLGNSAVLAKIGMSLLSFANISTLLVIVYLVLGIGIGALGSTISMRKYLKV